MGIETEYGISIDPVSGEEPIHPMVLSNVVVRTWAETTQLGQSGWDYSTESPLRDQRGTELRRVSAHPDLLTDVDAGMANLVLTNGARFYVDHAHPEFSGPEVTTALDAVVWDRAGDAILTRAAQLASETTGRRIRIHKNNVDGKGASYGTHENYLLERGTPFHRVVRQFSGFLATRQVFTGSGRVGIGQQSEQAGFQITQRADYFEAEVGLETTLNRPVINTRDEPHADPRRHRRLHVITGDATQAEWSTWLKVGTAALVLRALEANLLTEVPVLARPVEAMHRISHDPSCRATVADEQGRDWTAIAVQRCYLEACRRLCGRGPFGTDAQYQEALRLLEAWQDVLDRLEQDPLGLADRLEWVAKWRLLRSYLDRDGLDWSHPKLAMIDLQFSELDERRGLFTALERKGRIERLTTPEQVAAAVTDAPSDTRAWLRGELMRRHGSAVMAASWDSVVLDVPGRTALQRLEMMDPLGFTRDRMTPVLDAAGSLTQLIATWPS
ncbi:MAG TPA: proteasome accessory factor PafA2 [Candidatus Avipropionibacterium avicola]|uniref:Proteasome accessory factor PafA2 n=1 Tax=Candidatus Avipropionibacterium avicola TaxID=2840701 RepID=A0A9D1H017_9ACTN|nr:proteasome accessory factor PafA2 [Candidatus Avipropionibacterium avicola]